MQPTPIPGRSKLTCGLGPMGICCTWSRGVQRAIGRPINAHCSTTNRTRTQTTRNHAALHTLQDHSSVEGETSHSSPPSPASSSHWQACTPITRPAPCMHTSSDPDQPKQQTCCCCSRSCPEAGTSSTCGVKPAGEGVKLHPQHSKSSSHPGRGGRSGEWYTPATHATSSPLSSYTHICLPCLHFLHEFTHTRCACHAHVHAGARQRQPGPGRPQCWSRGWLLRTRALRPQLWRRWWRLLRRQGLLWGLLEPLLQRLLNIQVCWQQRHCRRPAPLGLCVWLQCAAIHQPAGREYCVAQL